MLVGPNVCLDIKTSKLLLSRNVDRQSCFSYLWILRVDIQRPNVNKDENDIRSKVLLKFQTQHKFFQDKFLNIGKIHNILALKNPTKYPKSEFL